MTYPSILPPHSYFWLRRATFPFFFSRPLSSPLILLFPLAGLGGCCCSTFGKKHPLGETADFLFLVCFLPSPALQLITRFSVPRGEGNDLRSAVTATRKNQQMGEA